MARRIVVVGGGFAGLWSAASAARARALFDQSSDTLEIVCVSADPFHAIRVRCYEQDLAPVRLPLDSILAPIGVRRVQGRVTSVARNEHRIDIRTESGDLTTLDYDRLILAPGSVLARPPVPGVGDAFDVDSYEGARRLAGHLATLSGGIGARTAVVVGGGLVGIEIACELPQRLRTMRGGEAVRVVLVDHGDIGAAMGKAAKPVILEAFRALGVERRSMAGVRAVDQSGVTLEDGEHIPSATVIFATGMRASPLMREIGVPSDPLGRVAVDQFLRVEGADGIYAAGDAACAKADDSGHATVMSCQHARPMGRLAGHNAVCDLLNRPDERVAFAAPDYVTILDLGPFGAVYTSGWDRDVLVAKGAEAKATKQTINGRRIYPPADADAESLFAAAAPAIQTRPAVRL